MILDIPLLFESGLDLLCGGVIFVGLRDQEVQIERLLARDRDSGGNMTREDAESRVKSQMSVAEKVERVEKCWDGKKKRGYVVWNDGTREELQLQLKDVTGKFKEGRGNFYTQMGRFFPPWIVLRAMVVLTMNWWRNRTYFQEQRKSLKAKI